MSKQDNFSENQTGPAPGSAKSASTSVPEPPGRSAELAKTLAAISEMMQRQGADQTAALADMQERISDLTQQTESTDSTVPGELRAPLVQLEAAMAQLTNQSAGSNHANKAALPGDQPGTGTEDNLDDALAKSDSLKALATMLSAESSSDDGQTPATTEPASSPATAAPGFVDGDPDDPWDEAAAEQLTRHYESGEAGLPVAAVSQLQQVATPLQEATTPPPETDAETRIKAPVETEIATAPPLAAGALSDDDRSWLLTQIERVESNGAAPARNVSDNDRDWFLQQFARITAGIEAGLAAAATSEPLVDAIDGRLTELENRVEGAVEALTNGRDPHELKEIEACIIEISAQLERSQIELARIDTIEADIRTLADRLSDERLEALTATGQGEQHAALDPEQIAEFVGRHVAETAAQRITEVMPQSAGEGDADGNSLESVHGLLNSLIMEQRNEGKQTTDRLEALHRDMSQLLQRIEGLETETAHVSATAPAAIQAGFPATAARLPNDAMSQSRAPSSPAPAADQTLAEAMPPAREADPLGTQQFQSAQTPPLAQTQDLGSGLPGEQAPMADRPAMPAATDTAAPDEQTADQALPAAPVDRSSFLAEARRAAAKANARLQQANAETAEGSTKTTRTAPRAATTDAGKPQQASAKTSRTRLAIAALAAVAIALGAGSMLFGWPGGSNLPTAATDKAPATPGRSTNKKASDPTQPSHNKPASALGVPGQRSHARIDSDGDGLPDGVALTSSASRLTPAQIAELERRREMAALSTKVGASQPVARSLPTSLVLQATKDQASSGRITGVANNKLPSALVGPLSLRIAAANGDPSASFEVGARFAEGKGVQQNFREAAKWYTQSASKGFAIAQYRLATLYERGLGVDTDVGRAKVWYERAARQGNVKSMHNLAVLVAGGKGGATDYGTAARWFAEAAERGLSDSQFNLAILYENGLGVSKNLQQAYKWFGIAARSGDADADQRRKGLVGKLKASVVTATDKAITDWRRRAISRVANDARFAGTLWKKQQTSKSSS